ncbi:hypothetical protein GCM10027343_43330 [Noviherbaspirillum agri]
MPSRDAGTTERRQCSQRRTEPRCAARQGGKNKAEQSDCNEDIALNHTKRAGQLAFYMLQKKCKTDERKRNDADND